MVVLLDSKSFNRNWGGLIRSSGGVSDGGCLLKCILKCSLRVVQAAGDSALVLNAPCFLLDETLLPFHSLTQPYL